MKLLDLKQVAERLDVHYDTARDFVVSGILPARRLAGRRKWQVLEDDLNEFVEKALVSGPIAGPKPRRKGPKTTVDRRRKTAGNTMPHGWRRQYAR